MGPRSPTDDLAYGERWDADRFLFERDRERERIEERDRIRGPGGRPRESSPDRRDRRAVSSRPPWEDAYPPPRERRYVDDDVPRFRRSPPPEIERDVERRVVVDKEQNYRTSSPPRRPGMLLRRQSSLDTFDRRPLHRFEEKEEYGPPARRAGYRPEPYTPIPLPRSRALPPPRIYAERDTYDEIRIAEPDRYGNEEYHPYPERLHEREIARLKQHRGGSRTSKSRRSNSPRSSSRTSTSSSSSSSSSGGTAITVKSEYPKKGKTRIPARLVSTRALLELRYPFIQEVCLTPLGDNERDY